MRKWESRTVTELDLDAASIASVPWATSYRTDFGWLDLPIFDEWGYPRHGRGITEQRGLYAVGLRYLYHEVPRSSPASVPTRHASSSTSRGNTGRRLALAVKATPPWGMVSRRAEDAPRS